MMVEEQAHAMTTRELLALTEVPAIIAVVGCGGKTTFIEKLARSFQDKRVLISPTTKIKAMVDDDITHCYTLAEVQHHQAKVGIQCLGIWDPARQKVKALPADLLASIVKDYDVVLLEADGSRELPCKAWADYEPVIPAYVTHTVGIANLRALYQRADEKQVFHLDMFLQMTGLAYGDAITLRSLFTMISDPRGLFKASQGKRILLINQVEDDTSVRWARCLLNSLRKYQQNIGLYAYGSAYHNYWKGV